MEKLEKKQYTHSEVEKMIETHNLQTVMCINEKNGNFYKGTNTIYIILPIKINSDEYFGKFIGNKNRDINSPLLVLDFFESLLTH
jgi:hypothetical protein